MKDSKYIEVIFRSERTGFFFNKHNLTIVPDDIVIVKVDRGEDIARVINASIPPDKIENIESVMPVLRKATDEDLEKLQRVRDKEEEAKEIFLKIVKKYPFDMKLIDVVYQFDGNKLIFFFAAENRVDFREFVRELANIFKTRIELHQSSGREDAKRYGGIAICGKQYCCTTFLKKYDQITIKMAKDQNLLNNLSKLTGPCGRLLCCLAYEEDFYVEKAKEFPEVGTIVNYNKKNLTVQKNDFILENIYLVDEENRITILPLKDYKKKFKNAR